MRYEQKLAGQGLEPGVTREFTGVLVCRDWEADVIANTLIEVRQLAGGAAELRLVHLKDKTDVRSVPIGEAALEALAAALFGPKAEDPTVAEPIPLGAGRPDLMASGMMSYRLRWAWQADASPRFGVEIAEGVTRVTITGEGDRPVVVSSTSWEVERHWRRLLYAGIVADQPDWWARGVQGQRADETPAVVNLVPTAKPARSRPPGMSRFSPTPRRRYPRIRMEGGAILGVRRGKGREFTYAPKLDITLEDGHVCAIVGQGERPVMSTHPAVVAFFESFDEALRRDKSRQLRKQNAAEET